MLPDIGCKGTVKIALDDADQLYLQVNARDGFVV